MAGDLLHRSSRPFRTVVLFLSVSLSLSLAPVTSMAVVSSNNYRLLVLHTNDMHSSFDEIDETNTECHAPGRPCYGGFARLKAAVDEERRSAGDVDGTLFLNAGDTFQGTAFYTFFRWQAVGRMLRTLGIDVMCLGNHEFDDGVKDVELFLRNITIPVVSGNLDLTGEPSLASVPNLMKSKVLTVNGRKIGIIGYLTPETVSIADVGNVKILPEIPSVAAEAKRLKNDGVNILIALGHSGFEMDKQIARDVEDIDLVIGGHSNTFLYTGNSTGIDGVKSSGSYPFWVEQPNTKRKVPVVQAYCHVLYLGKLWLEFDEAGEIVKSYGNPILLDSRIGQDPEILNEVKIMKKSIEDKTKQVIGSTSVFLEGENRYCRIRECNLGNFITDSFVDYNIRNNFNSFDMSKYWTDAPIALLQAGGIRTNINQLGRRGNITYGDLLSSLPFKNDIGKITTKGSDIWAAFEFSVRRYTTTLGNGEFLQASGLKVVIDFSRPIGKRVQSIHARCGNCTVPIYEKLDLNGNYTIIMSFFMSNGGDGLSFKKVVGFQSLGALDADIMEEELHLKSPIWPEIGDRIVLLNVAELNKTTTATASSGRRVLTSSGLTLLLSTVAVALRLTTRLVV